MLTVKVNVCTLTLPASLKQKAKLLVPAAAITFLEADLTDNMAAACQAEPWGGLVGLTETDVAKDWDGHGAEGQEGLAGSRRLKQMPTLLAAPWGEAYRSPSAMFHCSEAAPGPEGRGGSPPPPPSRGPEGSRVSP